MSPDAREAAPEGRDRGLVALLAALAAWGGWFIYRSMLTVGGRRVACLFDDAMISMTYARNLVDGHGLNWARRGAPVEGFTHPLWTAMMVPVQLLPLPLDRRALVVQLVSLATLAGNVVLVRRLMLRHFGRPGACHWAPAGVLTAFYFPLAFWALIGMETGLQSLLTTTLVLWALDIVHLGRDRYLALGLAGAAAVLLRMDLLLTVAAVAAYVALLTRGRPAAPPAAAARPALGLRLLPLGLPVAALAGYAAFRFLYFRDILPNTYYLKLGGVPLAVRLLHGGSVLIESLRAHGPLLLVVAAGLAPLLWGRGRDRAWGDRLALPALLFALACAYSVYVGGDAWEDESRANRFVAFAMPLVFVLGNALLNQALGAWARSRATAVAAGAGGTDGGGALPLPVRYALVTATLLALFVADGLWRHDDAEDNWKSLAVIHPPLHADMYEALLDEVAELRKIADPTAAVAVTWAGTPAYFSDFRMIDELGYNDRSIAREAPAHRFDELHFDDFVPGHVKWDIGYVLEKQHPDALLQIWGGEEARQALLDHGFLRLDQIWIDPSSPRIHLPPGAFERLDEGDPGDDTAASSGADADSGTGRGAAQGGDGSGSR